MFSTALLNAFLEDYVAEQKQKEKFVSNREYLEKIISLLNLSDNKYIDDNPDGLYAYTPEDERYLVALSSFFRFIEIYGGIVENENKKGSYFPEQYIVFSYKNINYVISTIYGQGAITMLFIADDAKYKPSVLLFP